LGLTIGAVPAAWMYIASILLAIIGVSLGIVAENSRGNTALPA